MNKYLFILCPGYSGSTLLWRVLHTSKNVSALPTEGQYLPGVREIMLRDRWNPTLTFPWEAIREEWRKYWDLDKPVLLDKSVPNFIRASQIEKVFDPSYFVIMMRDPYALCEAYLRRRSRMLQGVYAPLVTMPDRTGTVRRQVARYAAMLWVKFASLQMENMRSLARTVRFSYEDLTERPDEVKDKIARFIPEISDVNVAGSFLVHSVNGTSRRPLINMNEIKWRCLSSGDIHEINEVLSRYVDVLGQFGYGLRHPDQFQDARALAMRSRALASRILSLKRDEMRKLVFRHSRVHDRRNEAVASRV